MAEAAGPFTTNVTIGDLTLEAAGALRRRGRGSCIPDAHAARVRSARHEDETTVTTKG